MKATAILADNGFSQNLITWLRRQIMAVILFTSLAGTLHATIPGGPGGTNIAPSYFPLASWTFLDHTNWTGDQGQVPISFTNLSFSYLGNGASLVVDTNLPAGLNYNVMETNGATNLTLAVGSVTFWFAPGSWSSTNAGGPGPGEFGRLLEVGGYTTNSSYGWWSIYVDQGGNNLYFSAQTNDLSGTFTNYLSAPISWTTNYFHYVALTFSTTNTALYIDGGLVTNGPPVTVYPGPQATTNGLFIGSDYSGTFQAHGLFNSVQTYNIPLDANTIQQSFKSGYTYYELNPLNSAMALITSAGSSSTTYSPVDSITGQGALQLVGSAPTCVNGTNAYNVWITNVVASVASNGTMNLQFSIEGGSNNVPFDVFANSVLSFGPNGVPWAWMGQGYQCNTYLLTGLPNTTCFLILGTPQDTTLDGLTDAYKLLVAKADPNAYSTDGTGMADGWEVLYFGHVGIDPNGDPDGDRLTTFQEWLMRSDGYNPAKWDSSTNSIVGDGYQDYSGDGLANLLEASFGGNMLTNNTAWKANTAGDGFPDEYKTMVGLSTNSAVPVPGLPTYTKNPIQ